MVPFSATSAYCIAVTECIVVTVSYTGPAWRAAADRCAVSANYPVEQGLKHWLETLNTQAETYRNEFT
jgi:hypothetical protein